MKLYININCRFVKGFKNAAIYDFNNNKVFAINESGKKIIEKGLCGQKLLEEEKLYINELLDLHLLSEKNAYKVIIFRKIK